MTFRLAICLTLAFACIAATAIACPFCNAVKPTLVQQREAAVAAFIGELLDKPSDGRATTQSFKIDRVLKGKDQLGAGPVRLTADVPVKQGSLVLLLGNGAADAGLTALPWTAVLLDEAAVTYVVR